MKRIILALAVVASVLTVLAQSTITMRQFAVVNSSTTVPKQLTNASLAATSVTLMGYKSPQTSNTSTVYVSYGQDADAIQAVPVAVGGVVVLELDPGNAQFSVSNLWMDVTTANDGLIVIYDKVK